MNAKDVKKVVKKIVDEETNIFKLELKEKIKKALEKYSVSFIHYNLTIRRKIELVIINK